MNSNNSIKIEKSYKNYYIVAIIIIVLILTFVVEISHCPYCKGTGIIIYDMPLSGRQRIYCEICGGDGHVPLFQWILGIYYDIFYPPDGYG
jgi:hypothetical protein